MRKSPLNADLVNPRFFGFSIACLSFILVMSCAMISVFLTANDPYWSWYSILFSFRLQLTDVFSNLLRDSLIEARFESTKGMRLPHDNSYLNKQQLMPSAPAPSRQSHAVVIQTLSLQTESSGSTTQKAPNNQLGPPKMQTSTGGTPNLASPKRRQPQSRDGQSLPKDQTALLSRRLSTGSIIPSPPESLDSLVQAR
ncbi:hypothetical protein BC831DRAFT_463059 [Entophlyctis helioformis]|nr:hypothetical protein BC831DRAFT_463059 [Entophlyctis helioformis]